MLWHLCSGRLTWVLAGQGSVHPLKACRRGQGPEPVDLPARKPGGKADLAMARLLLMGSPFANRHARNQAATRGKGKVFSRLSPHMDPVLQCPPTLPDLMNFLLNSVL